MHTLHTCIVFVCRVVITSRHVKSERAERRFPLSARLLFTEQKVFSWEGNSKPGVCVYPHRDIAKTNNGSLLHGSARTLIVNITRTQVVLMHSTRPITVSCSLPLENDLSWIVLAHEIYRAGLPPPPLFLSFSVCETRENNRISIARSLLNT